MRSIATKLESADDNIIVDYTIESGLPVVKELLTFMRQHSIQRGIIITFAKPLSSIAKEVWFAHLLLSESIHQLEQEIRKVNMGDDFHMETFKDAELLYNVTHHEAVPQHRLITDAEKQAVMRKLYASYTLCSLSIYTDASCSQ